MTSLKRNLIIKSNSTIVAITSGACFIVMFCIVASSSLINQFSYQNRVIQADNSSLSRIEGDIHTVSTLENSYNAFIDTPTNIIGGNPNGSGPQDGTNTKIILDSLPSTYDYPALANSLDAVLTNQGVQIQSISGTDDSSSQPSQSSSDPSPQPIPFSISVSGSYTTIQNVVNVFEESIRPFQIQSMELSGNQSQLTLTITAQTYWQPAKSLNESTELVK